MIIRPVQYLWAAAFATVAVLAVLAAAVGGVAGMNAGLSAFVVGLVAVGAYHVHNLGRLVVWVRAPIGTPVPHAGGSWGRVFAELHSRARFAEDMRARLSAVLERFDEASQAMPDGVLYLSARDTIEWINVKAEQHFGLDRSRDIGAPATNLIRQPEFVRYLASRHYDEPLVMHSTRHAGLTLQVQIIPFGADQNMVLSRDISQLEKLETMRRDFVANVSHELRTPLTVVGGFLETLVDGLDDFTREDAIRFLRLALEQSTRMRHLIDDLLTLSALETGAPAPAEERIDVSTLMEEIRADTELLSAGRHTVTLEMHGNGILLGSAKEIHSAFANLARNAVRYTPEDGKIALQWRTDEHGAEFAVRDNGIGIDPDHIPRITERFYRVDRGRSRETGGTGLGLAIVKHICTRHQAELRVSSTLGEGSTFTVRLPRSRMITP